MTLLRRRQFRRGQDAPLPLPETMIPARSPLFLTASILFLLSGMVGLGYELIWIRKAALVVGSSQIAMSTVLTAFFLGLALGSRVVGQRFRSRRWSPLFVYGLFEAAIGLFALAFPWLFDLLEAVYGAAYPLFEGSGAALFALRFLLLFGLFLVPTVFMGGTLPLLLDGLVERDAGIGSRTSVLYGINILGAVVGVLVTSYFAIPALGLNGTSLAGAVCNLTIGLVAIVAFRRLRPIHADVERPPLERFFPAAAFASGLLAIAWQIAWVRYFNLFNTGTVYLTAILLAVYLLALAAGSFLLAPLLARWSKPMRILAVVQALVPILALWGLEAWRAAEYRFAIDGSLLESLEIDPDHAVLAGDRTYTYFWSFFSETADATFFAPLFQVALTIFLPVTLIGAGLPSIIAAAARTSSGLRSVSGRLLFWNTVGSSLGGFAAGYVLLPALGLHGTLVLLGLGSLGLSLAAHLRGDPEPVAEAAPLTRAERRRAARSQEASAAPAPSRAVFGPGLILPGAGLAAVLLFALTWPDVTRYTIQRHGYGRDVGYRPDGPPRPDFSPDPPLAVVEGPLTTSFLFDAPDGSLRLGSGNVCLAVAYKDRMSTQAIQGHLPCLFYPGTGLPRDCLGICLGSGQSFGALLLYPIARLDVVDISSEIVRLSLKWFGPYNHGLDTDPRARIHLDDGRHFVERAADDSYDVVSMEPPPPTAEGVSSLYSIEFYEEVARILRPTGVFMQWLPLYRITPLDARGIVKTQAAVFPATFVVKAGQDDFMVVSYASPPRIPLEAIRERAKVFETERGVKGNVWSKECKHPLASLEGILSALIMGPDDVRDMQAPVLYRDDTQILSYTSGDRELLRRYEGPVLSPVSFSALRLTPFERMAGFFEPPLGPELAVELDRERARSLRDPFGVPDPVEVEGKRRALAAATDPADRAKLALELAAAFDGMLAKDEAFRYVEVALDALGTRQYLIGDAERQTVRGIVRNRLSPLASVTREWMGRLAAKRSASPLWASMRDEYDAYRKRDAERRSRYLFEKAP